MEFGDAFILVLCIAGKGGSWRGVFDAVVVNGREGEEMMMINLGILKPRLSDLSLGIYYRLVEVSESRLLARKSSFMTPEMCCVTSG